MKYGLTKGKEPVADREFVRPFGAAGAIWWIEEIFTSRGSLKQIQTRIAAGPPR